MTALQTLARPFWILFCMVSRWALVLWETAVVLHLMKKMKAGMLRADHPWVTGQCPEGGAIWPKNLVYRSPGTASEQEDAERVSDVGRFLASMVRKSLPASPETPQGPKRRMPHAVNYLHGAIHYSGAFMVFEDFADLVSHLSDPAFRRDLLRFGRKEKREVTFVLRERQYDPLEFAWCVGAVRAFLPWFSNGNGPTKKPVLWGNASPHAAIALINGAWIADTMKLRHGDVSGIVRPPSVGSHFQPGYRGVRSHFTFFDRLLAWVMFTDVRLRGFGGQLFFTDRRVIEPQRLEEYEKAGGYWKWVGCHRVPNPFRRP